MGYKEEREWVGCHSLFIFCLLRLRRTRSMIFSSSCFYMVVLDSFLNKACRGASGFYKFFGIATIGLGYLKSMLKLQSALVLRDWGTPVSLMSDFNIWQGSSLAFWMTASRYYRILWSLSKRQISISVFYFLGDSSGLVGSSSSYFWVSMISMDSFNFSMGSYGTLRFLGDRLSLVRNWATWSLMPPVCSNIGFVCATSLIGCSLIMGSEIVLSLWFAFLTDMNNSVFF